MTGPEDEEVEEDLEDDWIEEDEIIEPEEGYEGRELPFWSDWDEIQYPDDTEE